MDATRSTAVMPVTDIGKRTSVTAVMPVTGKSQRSKARPADCWRTRNVFARCATCGATPELLHSPLRIRGFFCATHCRCCARPGGRMSETETARHTLLQSCAAARLGTSARLGTTQPSSHVVGNLRDRRGGMGVEKPSVSSPATVW